MKTIVTFGCELTHGTPGTTQGCAWPGQLARKCGTTVINCAIPRASNREILDQVINYDYTANDFVIILWTFVDRDLLPNDDFDINAAWHNVVPGYRRSHVVQVGPWLTTEQANDWRSIHSLPDAITRSWIHFHHANSWLAYNKIPCYNLFASRSLNFENAIPGFITEQTTDFDTVLDLDTGSQQASELSHRKFANELYSKVLGLATQTPEPGAATS